jgi:anti-anti-sigma factor
MEISQQGDGVLRLQGDLHISDVEALRSALAGGLAAGTALVLEISGVDRCDTASLQLLCSLRRSAEKDGKDLRIFGASEAIREASSILGLSLEYLTHAPTL